MCTKYSYLCDNFDNILCSCDDSGNIGILTKRSSALLKSDMKPAVFWTSTPSNNWYDNVAVHSYHFGMWFELAMAVQHSMTDNDPSPCPVHQYLGQFNNNTVHGNANIGLRIYPEYTPLQIPCNVNSPPAPQYFYRLLSYRNGANGLFSKRHGYLHHIGHTLLENAADEISIVKYVAAYSNVSTFDNCLIIASLRAPANPTAGAGKLAIFAPQGEYFYIRNTTIVNYGTAGAIGSCNECFSGEMMAQGAYTYRFKGLRFVNTTRRIRWMETKKDIYWDLDGSLAGVANTMITRDFKFNRWPECSQLLPVSKFDTSIRCNPGVTIRKMAIDNVSFITSQIVKLENLPGLFFYTQFSSILALNCHELLQCYH